MLEILILGLRALIHTFAFIFLLNLCGKTLVERTMKNTTGILYFLLCFGIRPIVSQTETILRCSSEPIIIQLSKVFEEFKYPQSGNYPRLLTCNWRFEVPDPDSRISIRYSHLAVICEDDINLFDGPDQTSTYLDKKRCCTGSCTVQVIFSTSGNSLFLQFTADSSTSDSEKGFTIQVVTGKDYSQCINDLDLDVPLASEQRLTSPKFPLQYPKNIMGCVYKYSFPGGHVGIDIMYMTVEDHSNDGDCEDSIELYDGSSSSSTPIDTLCGSLYQSRSFRSTGPDLTVKFTSDPFPSSTDIGFYANVYPVTIGGSETTTTTDGIETTTVTTNALSAESPQTTRCSISPFIVRNVCCIIGDVCQNSWNFCRFFKNCCKRCL